VYSLYKGTAKRTFENVWQLGSSDRRFSHTAAHEH